MKRNLRWLMGVLLICGLWMFVSCANDDNPAMVPDTEQLQDGEWRGVIDAINMALEVAMVWQISWSMVVWRVLPQRRK